MPTDIKKAAVALIVSCFSTLTAVYFDGIEFEEAGFGNPFTIGINAVWVLAIAWIIWDLLKGKNIRVTLFVIGAIMLASLFWDLVEFGFGISQIFYAVEIIMFLLAYFLISTRKSKNWYVAKNL